MESVSISRINHRSTVCRVCVALASTLPAFSLKNVLSSWAWCCGVHYEAVMPDHGAGSANECVPLSIFIGNASNLQA